MYTEFWGLKEKPFNNTPDPRFFYASPQHEDAMMKLSYAVGERMGAALMTGVFGCGKTMVCRSILRALGSERYRFAVVEHSQLDEVQLLRAIVRNLKSVELPETRSELMADAMLETLGQVLLDNARDGKDTVIIVDEAHAIENDRTFEALRLLLNFQLDDRFLMTLLLIGQPELANKVGNLKQLEQRIAVRCHLDRLDAGDTVGYIAHRLQVAGAQKPMFTDDAVALLCEQSGGIPRRINHLCDLSLASAFGKQAKSVDAAIVKKAVKDFGIV